MHRGSSTDRFVDLVRSCHEVDFVFDPLADHVRLALQGHTDETTPSYEDLLEARHGLDGGLAQDRRVDRDISPSQDVHAFVGDDGFDGVSSDASLFAVLGEKGHPGGVSAFGGQVEVDDRPEEPVGYLYEQPCSVTRVRVGS